MEIPNRMFHAVAKPRNEGWHDTPQEEQRDEAARFYQGHRNRCGRRRNHGSAGDRAVDAGAEMAHDGKLAEIA
jgi:hypothetical protein